jgi:lipopolysaccharide biosynthesis protein
MLRLGRRSKPEPVNALVGDRVRVERGSLSVGSSSRIAVIAHWSLRPRVTKSVCTLVRELQAFGYRVIVCSSCESPEQLVWDVAVGTDTPVVIRKPNIGYDFGSWSVALERLPAIAEAKRVIFANDSMSGPFIPLRPLLEQFETTPADVWGLTDTRQFAPHLQSYFLGFCDGVLTERPLAQFWAGIRDEPEKQQIILRSEIGLSQLLRQEGYVQVPAFHYERFVEPGQNPVIVGWKQLLEQGFPFLKREILRDPTVAPEGRTAPAVVSRLLGVDVAEWVDDVIAHER